MSARDTQTRELPIGMGPAKAKDWDGSNVLGPCIVTADELDGTNVRMSVRVNGETWGEDSSSHMHHTFAALIAYASQSQTLYPGEVFGSGTAAGGSGMELDRWLREGDVVELEIEGSVCFAIESAAREDEHGVRRDGEVDGKGWRGECGPRRDRGDDPTFTSGAGVPFLPAEPRSGESARVLLLRDLRRTRRPTRRTASLRTSQRHEFRRRDPAP